MKSEVLSGQELGGVQAEALQGQDISSTVLEELSSVREREGHCRVTVSLYWVRSGTVPDRTRAVPVSLIKGKVG